MLTVLLMDVNATPFRRRRATEPSAECTWAGLVAATVAEELRRFKVIVGATRGLQGRLVVQAYRAADLVDGRPRRGARALSAVQRRVERGELVDGVRVDLWQLELQSRGPIALFGWVEAGQPDLEDDGLRAQPSAEALVGASLATDGMCELQLGTAPLSHAVAAA